MDEDTYYYFQLQIQEFKISDKVLGPVENYDVMKVNECNIFNLVPTYINKSLHKLGKLQKTS